MKLFKLLSVAIISAMLISTSVYADSVSITDCPPPSVETEVPTRTISAYASEPTVSPELYMPNESAYPIDENGHTKQVTTSYNSSDYFTFTITDSVLTYYGVNSDDSKLYFWPQLKLSSNALTQTLIKKSGNNIVKYSFDISSISDGNYDVEIYTSSTNYGTYNSYVYNQITLVKSGDDIYFQVPIEVYQINKDFIEKNYRSSDYYLHQTFPADYTKWVYTNDTVKGIAEEITAGCTTDYEKIKAVHDWAADNIYYDYDYYYSRTTSTPFTPEEVYANKYSVCQGYADFCASLLRSLDIPCKVASGYGKTGTSAWTTSLINGSSSNHAWNEAWLADEQRWVVFDATWDSSNTKNKTAGAGLVTAARRDTYFDITPSVFAGNHKVVYYSQQLYTSLGNVNLDSKVDNADVAAFLKHFSGVASLSDTALQEKYADVDGNLKIDFADVIATLKKLAFDKYV
jgi:hypothetical protein